MPKNAKLRTLVLIFCVLILPVAVFIMLQTGKNQYKQLPKYGPRQVAATFTEKRGEKIPDTLYHTIGSFNLLNQDGDAVTQTDLDGSIYVADFFFTTCPDICIEMSAQMARLAERFKNNSDIKFVSYTVDADNDIVPVLREYANKYGADSKQWMFLTGDKQQIWDLAKNSYLVPAAGGADGMDFFFHSPMFVLIDKHKRIRGFYDGTSKTSVDTLIDEIKVLHLEHLREIKQPG